jgi:hypothetical protein
MEHGAMFKKGTFEFNAATYPCAGLVAKFGGHPVPGLEGNQMDKTYRSKIDWRYGMENAFWFVLVAGMVVSFLLNPPPHGWPVAFVVLIVSVPFLVVAFAAWQASSTSYTITATELLVKTTFLRWRIPLHQIVKVIPTPGNPFSLQGGASFLPALSLDRLRVTYEWGAGRRAFVVISPNLRKQFLDDLAKAALLEKEGDRLVRRAD